MQCKSGPMGTNKLDENNEPNRDIESAQNQEVSPATDSEERVSQLRVEASASSWQGPIPPPHVMDGLNKAIPARDNLPPGGDRALVMAEKRNQHQIDHEKATLELEKRALELSARTIEAEHGRSKLGLVLGFIIALVGIGAGTVLAAIGKAGIGLLFGLGPLAGLAGVFVYGTYARRIERNHQDRNSS